MGKDLSDLTLEELWELFPISLVPHSEKWKQHYDEMENFLNRSLSGYPIHRISHIGSTAINGIRAKNIVDILIEIAEDADIKDTAKAIEQSGFTRMSTQPDRISFNYGYTKDGFAEKVFHLHLRYVGDHDELYFRDYLNEHPQIAEAYEAMKLRLWRQFEHDRDAYTTAKTAFVQKWTAEGKKAYPERY